MTVTWDDVRKVPYGCDSKHWVGYDNELSLYEKVITLHVYMTWEDQTQTKSGSDQLIMGTVSVRVRISWFR